MLPDRARVICMIYGIFPGSDLYYKGPAQHLIPAGWDLDNLHYTIICPTFEKNRLVRK